LDLYEVRQYRNVERCFVARLILDALRHHVVQNRVIHGRRQNHVAHRQYRCYCDCR
jgi:hypothetical protein